jgi:hypothetical protein
MCGIPFSIDVLQTEYFPSIDAFPFVSIFADTSIAFVGMWFLIFAYTDMNWCLSE